MHMADALVSPAVGGLMTAASAGLLWYSARNLRKNFDPSRVPLMGVMGAFVFAAQMINFTIPGTGSSGHIGGGMLLAAVLGSHGAFIALACVLAIQAFMFADGGILALGCNIFNMGFFPCFIAYPLIFLPIAKNMKSGARIMAASILGCTVALQLGAFGVVLETLCSGVTQLPFKTFALLMQPIHLAIGLVEGALTGAVLVFLKSARPEVFENATKTSSGTVCLSLVVAAIAMASGLSMLASQNPDGLEWSIERTAGSGEISADSEIHSAAEKVQEKSALLPDYNLPDSNSPVSGAFAGAIGTLATLSAAAAAGFALRKSKRAAQ